MRILLVGAGGVGTAFARIAARRRFAELIIADYDLGRAQHAAAARDGYQAVQLDARDEAATAALLAEHSCDVLMNATDPRFVMPLFTAARSYTAITICFQSLLLPQDAIRPSSNLIPCGLI